ncbi:MAG: hypothetical protein KKC80_05890 [Candidatus Margulisbacteria bacterium]|nr:hypothetical protein [Candidatus Margulisiibacteriota bacterium]MBU1616395.1 hypothetical protein [Candidatus Margulisiibacteriota bacterium]
MSEAKLDLILNEIGSMKEDIGSLKAGQEKLEKGQKEHYGLIQKNGVAIEALHSDVKAVAEGHSVLFNKIDEVKELVRGVDDKVEEKRKVVKDIDRDLKAHVKLPVHA